MFHAHFVDTHQFSDTYVHCFIKCKIDFVQPPCYCLTFCNKLPQQKLLIFLIIYLHKTSGPYIKWRYCSFHVRCLHSRHTRIIVSRRL